MKTGCLILLLCVHATAAEFFVSTNGTPANDGSYSSPWSLSFALTNSASVSAGDTIWLRGGTYIPTNNILTGTNFPSGSPAWAVSLTGSSGQHITFRSYTNEWAKLDRPLRLYSSDYLQFRDLEFYDSLKGVDPGNPSYPNPTPWPHIDDNRASSHNEWVNCLVHDANSGWNGGTAGQSIRGCIIWHIGENELHHVTYPSPDEFSGNVIGWGTADALNLNEGRSTFTMRSNIVFGMGQTISGLTVGTAARTTTNSVIAFNSIYSRFSTDKIDTAIKVNGGSQYVLSNNFIASSGGIISFIGTVTNTIVSGNTFHMSSPFASYAMLSRTATNGSWSFGNNRYTAQPNTLVRFEDLGASLTFSQWQALGFDSDSSSTNSTLPVNSVQVYRNFDEHKRAHIAVFNWTTNHNATVDVSGVLNNGDGYRLYSAQNYGGGPIKTGTVNGGSISVPLTNLASAPLLYVDTNFWSMSEAPVTSPEFAAFVIKGFAARSVTANSATIGRITVR